MSQIDISNLIVFLNLCKYLLEEGLLLSSCESAHTKGNAIPATWALRGSHLHKSSKSFKENQCWVLYCSKEYEALNTPGCCSETHQMSLLLEAELFSCLYSSSSCSGTNSSTAQRQLLQHELTVTLKPAFSPRAFEPFLQRVPVLLLAWQHAKKKKPLRTNTYGSY